MSDPKNIDWNEVVEDAQRLDMLRLQREQTDLLKGMSQGTSRDEQIQRTSHTLRRFNKKLGMSYADNPEEFRRRLRAHQKKQLHWQLPLLGLMIVILLLSR